MANIDPQDTYTDWLRTENQDQNDGGGRTSVAPVPPMASGPPMTSGPSESDITSQLQSRLGSLFDPTVTQDVIRNASYNGGSDTQSWIDRIVNKNLLRASNQSDSTYVPNGKGGFTVGPTGMPNTLSNAISAAQKGNYGITQWGAPGARTSTLPNGMGAPTSFGANQFDDPYTSALESLIKSQLNFAQQPVQSGPWDALSGFLSSRFNELSQTPGYTPAERAILNTQALEPIEALRTASQQRALQRAAAGGFLPTSGITQLTQGPTGSPETYDTAYDRMRTQANRDLAIAEIGQRRQDLNSALGVGQSATQLPEQLFGAQQNRNQAALQLATLLQQLPAQAQAEAMAVLNGTASPNTLLSQVNGMAQQNRQANFSTWANLGQLAYDLLNR
jgi:hypothetical protein